LLPESVGVYLFVFLSLSVSQQKILDEILQGDLAEIFRVS